VAGGFPEEGWPEGFELSGFLSAIFEVSA